MVNPGVDGYTKLQITRKYSDKRKKRKAYQKPIARFGAFAGLKGLMFMY